MKRLLLILSLLFSFTCFGQGEPDIPPATNYGSSITYATYDPSHMTSGITLSGGNDVVTIPGGTRGVRSTIGKTSGKYYWECIVNSGTFDCFFGVANSSWTPGYLGNDANGWSWGVWSGSFGPYKQHSNSYITVGSLPSIGDVISITVDYGGATMNAYQNGTLIGTSPLWSSLSGGPFYAAMSSWGGSSSVSTTNFGASAWDSRTATLRTSLIAAGYTMGLY